MSVVGMGGRASVVLIYMLPFSPFVSLQMMGSTLGRITRKTKGWLRLNLSL